MKLGAGGSGNPKRSVLGTSGAVGIRLGLVKCSATPTPVATAIVSNSHMTKTVACPVAAKLLRTFIAQ